MKSGSLFSPEKSNKKPIDIITANMRKSFVLTFIVLVAACLPFSLPEPGIQTATQAVAQLQIVTVTPSITPTPTLHPLTIEYLRSRVYPRTRLTIEESLAAGPNYFRYIASYYSDGLKQYGLLTIPFGEKPETGWSVIIFNHGYIPPDVYSTTERYVAYMDGFARSGYIVFRPDYRGHANSEGEANGAYGRPDYVIDVLNAVAALEHYPDADANRIGMWGHSMGGYITLRAMVVDPDIKAGVIWGGVVARYESMLDVNGRPRYGSRRLVQMYGTPEEDPDFWAAISANSYLEDLSGPLQLHHARTDETVPWYFSLELAVEARAAGQVAELYIYEGDDHNITENFSGAILRSIEFFDTYVKGEIE